MPGEKMEIYNLLDPSGLFMLNVIAIVKCYCK